jgi:hypothetical protein
MYRDNRDLVCKYLRGVQVPRAKLKKVLAAACNRFEDDGIGEVAEMVLRILDELRPEGPGRKGRGQ